MTVTDNVHEKFFSIISNRIQINEIKRNSLTNYKFLKSALAKIDDTKMKCFIKWVIHQSKWNFYLAFNYPHELNKVTLYNRNLKSVLVIGYVTPLENLKWRFKEHKFIIEIIHIHSFEKGEGYKMMKLIIELSQKMEKQIYL